MLTIIEAAARMRLAGLDYSVATLRRWSYTWPDGEKKGPPPHFISPRKLRYWPNEVDVFIRDVSGQPGTMRTRETATG